MEVEPHHSQVHVVPGAGGKILVKLVGMPGRYGCGGGGGFGLSNGGNGSGGYARISWNMYWDTALNSGTGAYKYAGNRCRRRRC